MRWIAATIVLLVGCTDEVPPPLFGCAGEEYPAWVRVRTLDKMPQPMRMAVSAGTHGNTASVAVSALWGTTTVTARGIPPAIDDDGSFYCPSFDSSFHVSVAGVLASAGGGRWTCNGTGGPLCQPPSAVAWLVPDAGLDGSVAIIADESSQLEVPLGNALAPRTLTPLAPSDGIYHPGQQVSFTWSPSSDLTVLGDAYVLLNAASTAHEIQNIARTTDSIAFMLPDYVGDATLEVTLSATSTTRLNTYEVSTTTFERVDLPLTVVP